METVQSVVPEDWAFSRALRVRAETVLHDQHDRIHFTGRLWPVEVDIFTHLGVENRQRIRPRSHDIAQWNLQRPRYFLGES